MKYKISRFIFTLVSLLITALIIFGLALDMQQSLTQAQLETAFYISGIFGLLINATKIIPKRVASPLLIGSSQGSICIA